MTASMEAHRYLHRSHFRDDAMPMDTTYIFVIDTEQYAGNFSRQLCAYITGHVGECEVGKEEADRFDREMRIKVDTDDEQHPFAFIVERLDDHKCSRPVAIWPTPGWFNHGMGGHFRDGQEAMAKRDHRAKCLKYIKTQKIHPAALAAHQKRWADRAKEPVRKWPAYLSVAIFMEREPTKKEVAILKRRAIAFGKRSEITITGFRLLREGTTISSVWEAKCQ